MRHTKSLAVALAGAIAMTVLPYAPALAALPVIDSQGATLPSLAPMLDKTTPGVVNIFTRTKVPAQQHPFLNDPFFRRFFEQPEQPRERYAQSLGSGVVVDAAKGYVLTNHHVIDRAVEISVNLSDGRTLRGELVGSDPETDLAVIKVPAEKLTAVRIADSEQLRVGDFVVAIGNPFGLGQTVTSGIVSALGRSGLGIVGGYEDFIQTDASINPGNSGGALVNLRGQLVGINTAILSRSGGNMGIGFAIPINMAKEVMAQLVEHGEVQRGQLGAQAQDLSPELATAFGIKEQRGAVVTQVIPNSPAHKAGLQAGDVITHVNSKPITGAADLRNNIGMLRIGQKVKLDIRRNGENHTLRAAIQEPEVDKLAGERLHAKLAGAVFGNIAEGMPMFGKVQGVLALDVSRGSPAWQAGVRRGDVVVSANRKNVIDLNELIRAVPAKSQTLLLNIQRQEGALFVLIQ